MPTIDLIHNGVLQPSKATIEGTEPTYVPTAKSDIHLGWHSVDYNNGSGLAKNGDIYTGSPLKPGTYNIRFIGQGGFPKHEVEVTYRQVLPSQSKIATKPRPTFQPGGHTLAANLDKPGMVVDGVEIIAGGSTLAPDGKAYESAGYGWQISADDCTIRNTKLGTFSEYAVYIRPGVKNALIENMKILGGTNFEASIRNAGGQVTLRNVSVIQDHTGIDNKRSRTLIRGPGEWTIEDCTFAGGTVGCNPMARLNAGQDLGFGEFQLGRGTGDINTSEGGQILRPTLMMNAVQAAIDARAAGHPRREIVRAAIVAGMVRSASAPDIMRVVEDTLWNRDRMLAQNSVVTFTRCKFIKSPDGVPVRIEIQPGAIVRFVDCEATDGTDIIYEWQYPDANKYTDRHPTNTDWTMPGDTVRPTPKVTSTRFNIAGKLYVVPEAAQPSIA